MGAIAHIAAGQVWVAQAGLITASSPGSITVSYFQETSYQVPQAGNRFYIVGSFAALGARRVVSRALDRQSLHRDAQRR